MAFGSSTITDFGGAVSDLFAAQADKAKQQNDYLEGQEYGLASDQATQNEKFTETSTAIKQAQLDRENYKTIGGQQADVAGAGFSASGSALDLMRDSASQGALTKAVGEQQGLIQEAGYTEQAKSYSLMQEAANNAGNAEGNASVFADITGGLKIAAGIASVFTGLPDFSQAPGGKSIGDPTVLGGLY
jgi:hypothetical protein